MTIRKLIRDNRGAAVIEMAFALPTIILLIWILLQLALVFRASAGIQHALGEGARAATVWSVAGVDASAIRTKVEAAVYGIGPGDFDVPTPTAGTGCDSQCLDVTVNYTQDTDMIFLPGPTINISHTKRVWLAKS